MIFPELFLVSSAFAGFGCPPGFFTQKSEVPIAQAYFPIGDILFIDLATRASGKSAAEGSLKIAELNHRDRGILVAQEMAALLDQEGHHLGA